MRVSTFTGHGLKDTDGANKKGNLAAFHIVDLAAKYFSTYVIGCHSKRTYTAGASDLLLSEMIDLSLENDKDYRYIGRDGPVSHR